MTVRAFELSRDLEIDPRVRRVLSKRIFLSLIEEEQVEDEQVVSYSHKFGR